MRTQVCLSTPDGCILWQFTSQLPLIRNYYMQLLMSINHELMLKFSFFYFFIFANEAGG